MAERSSNFSHVKNTVTQAHSKSSFVLESICLVILWGSVFFLALLAFPSVSKHLVTGVLAPSESFLLEITRSSASVCYPAFEVFTRDMGNLWPDWVSTSTTLQLCVKHGEATTLIR